MMESRFARNGRGGPEEIVPPLKAQSGQTGKGDSAPIVIQDARDIDKNQNGVGASESETAYTVDTTGAQGVAFNQRDEARVSDEAYALQEKPGSDEQLVQTAPTITRFNMDSRSPQSSEQQAVVGAVHAASASVRRLTPTETERLQAFTIVGHIATIRVRNESVDGGSTQSASAATESPPTHGDASPVDGSGYSLSAGRAESSSLTNRLGHARRARPSARIDFGVNALVVRTAGRSASRAEDAVGSASSYPLPLPRDLIARALALLRPSAELVIQPGAAASLMSGASSSRHESGAMLVELSGSEIAALAADVGGLTTEATEALRSITSGAGLVSPISDSTRRILCSYVSAAIAGYIPDSTSDGTSFEFDLLVGNDGWTCLETDDFGFMADGEPYSTLRCKCPDGPRYAAMGNAVTVNVVRWVAEQVDATL